MLFVITSQSLVASNGNLPPVAIIESDPTGTWFYNGSEVVFTNNSQDYDGYISYTKWYINGVYQSGGSYWRHMNTCFVLYDTPDPGNCYQMGQGQSTVSIKLQTRDNAGEWSSTTKTYTVKVHKGRRYFVKDHLGSVRATVDRDGVVIGHDDYYPFGLTMPGRSSNSANPNDNYKFTGHERDDEAGLTLDYMMARNYDPIIGRFLQIDPMYNLRYGLSPYNYVQNNPLTRIDPTGMIDILTARKDGTIEVQKTDDSFDVFMVENKDGSTSEVARLEKYKSSDGEADLVTFPESGYGFTRMGEADKGGDRSLQPKAAAALFGSINEITQADPSITVRLGDMSSTSGSAPSGTKRSGLSHKNGRNVDVGLIRVDRKNSGTTVTSSQFDATANQAAVNSFTKFGFGTILSAPTSNGSMLNNTVNKGGHSDHLHLQGFNPKVKN
jgi:RHS repeat-associated protein